MRNPLWLALAAVVTATGCTCGQTIEIEVKCTSSAECPTGRTCMSGTCKKTDGGTVGDGGSTGDGGTKDGGTPDAGPPATITALVLEPANASLTSTNGSKPTQAYVAKQTLSNGITSVATNAIFSADQDPIGTIDALSGLFTATGAVGGLVKIKAEVTLNGVKTTATTDLTVKLQYEVIESNVPATGPAKFAATPVVDAAREVKVVYPLDGVVFPQNVFPPDVQWMTAANGDLLRITLTKPNAKLVAYALELGDRHWLVQQAAWRAIAQTDPTAPATLVVDRFDEAAQQVVSGNPQTMKFARAALAGSVYYWDVGAGRIFRINDGTNTRANFMPSPPVANDGARCVGCHVVGPSGRFMSGRLGGGENIGATFDLTTNLSGDPAPTLFPTSMSSPRWWFSAFNPDETRLVMSIDEGGAGGMAFMDPKTGGAVTFAGTPTGKVTHVTWSPDGKYIAYVTGHNGWGGDSTSGNITVIPVTAPDTLGAPITVHTGASLGAADSYPTWSPDAKRIAFANGTGNRSESHQASLYWMTPSGTDVVKLTKANGAGAGNDNFQPRFSPFVADGYYWMSFLTRRDYGNDKVGTKGKGIQQIWVSAVQVNAPAGQDPSEVGYWLPGQDTTSRNIAAYWAPLACRKQNEPCAVGSECCSNVCAPNGMGSLVCSPPPPDRCRVSGESCSATSDCCPNKGLVCKANICQVDIN